jgi:hypothetical protein
MILDWMVRSEEREERSVWYCWMRVLVGDSYSIYPYKINLLLELELRNNHRTKENDF